MLQTVWHPAFRLDAKARQDVRAQLFFIHERAEVAQGGEAHCVIQRTLRVVSEIQQPFFHILGLFDQTGKNRFSLLPEYGNAGVACDDFEAVSCFLNQNRGGLAEFID